ncbi:topoisomerase DNA-binding C4 zinc finger domain-containing protein [Vibrio gelatinilyticus]|uniref:topoisomerase DNA-binding C4 zinc finger domain-containing protein n=1 Tax=Vibrio gelatinilyticus TaxID=2893468 RepID=UPI003CC57E1E
MYFNQTYNLPLYPFCPECNSDMALKKSKKGKFFECTSYPKYKKHLRPIDLD